MRVFAPGALIGKSEVLESFDDRNVVLTAASLRSFDGRKTTQNSRFDKLCLTPKHAH